MRLKDKAILITGSTTGIGEGMARMFASEGAAVMVHGTREDAAKKLVAEITATGAKADYVIARLDDPEAPQAIIEKTVASLGRLDGLVNNAAAITRGNLDETTLEDFEWTVAINLRAPLFLIKAALPQFRKQGGGRVLNIGSVNAYCGEARQCVYSVTKGGMMTMTRNIADAYGREGVRVNQFNVGWTLTPNEFLLKQKDGQPADWVERLPKTYAPSGRLLSPEDIAWAAIYFLSDEAQLINGTVLELEQYPLIGRNPSKE